MSTDPATGQKQTPLDPAAILRVIHEGLYELAEYDPDRPLDIAEVTITTRRISSGRISVEVAADLGSRIDDADGDPTVWVDR